MRGEGNNQELKTEKGSREGSRDSEQRGVPGVRDVWEDKCGVRTKKSVAFRACVTLRAGANTKTAQHKHQGVRE